MEGFLLTAGLVVLIVIGLAWLARSWPRSSTRTGYGVWKGEEDRDRGVTTPDDEAPWQFDDRGGGGSKA